MDRIYPVTVPKWGIEMQEGTVNHWHFAVGDTVGKGEELVDIESEKIVNAMEAPFSGVLRRILAEPEETLKVGQLLGVMSEDDVAEDEIDAFIEAFVPADAGFGIDDDDPGDDRQVTAGGTDAPGPEEAPPGGGSTATPPSDAADRDGAPREVRISPVARRLAEKLGVDVSTVQGTGRNGRISTEDVERAARAADGAGSAPEKIPLTSRALTAGRRLAEAKRTIPHFYLERELDMRAALAAKERDGVPLTALLLRALASALADWPTVNAHLVDDALHPQADISVNVAVDTKEGLVAPRLADLGGADAAGIATRLAALAERARNQALTADDLAPGGITLSNLGMLGIIRFSAIINPPQVAILAVGSVRPVTLALGAEPVPAMAATLSCDHRAIDGATGARFLAALQEALDAL